jgi:hypothetical protein
MKGQKHHYIPEFYLKQWAGLDGRLCEYSRPYKQVVAQMKHPGGTGYERGLYTMAHTPAHVADTLENDFFSIADGQAAETLQFMMKYDYVPSGREKASWTRFMLSLLYRAPEGVARSLSMIRQYYNEDSIKDFSDEYERQKRPFDPETLEEYVKENAPRMASQTTAQHLAEIIQSQRVSDKIISMQWHMGRINGLRHSILTSDRPMVMTNGIAHRESHIVMPLSPERILIATNTDEEANKIKALSENGKIAVLLNERMARQARRFVYGQDSQQLRFVENRLGEKVACSPFE